MNGYKFELCESCFDDYRDSNINKEQCAKWHEIDKWVGECQSGCSYYEETPTVTPTSMTTSQTGITKKHCQFI